MIETVTTAANVTIAATRTSSVVTVVVTSIVAIESTIGAVTIGAVTIATGLTAELTIVAITESPSATTGTVESEAAGRGVVGIVHEVTVAGIRRGPVAIGVAIGSATNAARTTLQEGWSASSAATRNHETKQLDFGIAREALQLVMRFMAD